MEGPWFVNDNAGTPPHEVGMSLRRQGTAQGTALYSHCTGHGMPCPYSFYSLNIPLEFSSCATNLTLCLPL